MKEKLIEEMAKVIHESDKIDNNILPSSLADCVIKHGGTRTNEAVALYEAGYRKQSEGEWVTKDGFFVCSNCDRTKPFAVIRDEVHYYGCNHCPNCGSKMKGGEG